MSVKAFTHSPFGIVSLQLWHQALAVLATQPLARLALAAIVAVLLGGLLRRPLPLLSGFLRFAGNGALIVVLLLTVVQVAHIRTGVPMIDTEDTPELSVTGGETRIAMGRDGHFWLRGRVNDTPARFLVDTGATLTTLSPTLAADADVADRHRKVMLSTANGTAAAELGMIDELHVGTIVARHLEVIVAPGMGGTNVLGMNFLSSLAEWRVEGKTLILTPHHPQKADADAERQD